MALLRIALAGEWVRPGGTVRARVAWHLDRPAEELVARLLWYTEGRGARDVGVVAEKPLDGSRLDGEAEVELPVPEGPYSFEGRLITLRWVVEIAVEPGGASEQAPLVVAPTPAPVQLHTGA